jgi:threonine efflux protein
VIWAVAAVFGVQIVLMKAEWLYRAMQFGGGCYLAYIGVQSWRHAKDAPPEGSAIAEKPVTVARAFLQGLVTNLSNPKVIVFFASIFTAVLDPKWPGWLRGVVLAVVFVDEVAYYSGLALLLSTTKARAGYRRAKTAIERTAGGAMLGFGGKLIYGSLRR